VDRVDLFDCLDLQYELSVDEQIEAMVAKEGVSVADWNCFLGLERDAAGREFNRHCSRIHTFEPSGSESNVNGKTTADGVVNQSLELSGQVRV
jgi:hypothetical protein